MIVVKAVIGIFVIAISLFTTVSVMWAIGWGANKFGVLKYLPFSPRSRHMTLILTGGLILLMTLLGACVLILGVGIGNAIMPL
jgi:hypothetical protein